MRVVSREACPQCDSNDNVAVYEDGHKHCFTPGCTYHTWADGSSPEFPPTKSRLEIMGGMNAIKDRRISQATCQKFGVTSDYSSNGELANHWYPYYNTKTGELCATKKRVVRTKDFSWSGDRTDMGLFGQQTCRGSGKYITITEGEIDALSVSEMFDRKYDVVSIPDGCQSARRALQQQLEWLEGYDHIVLCFDADKAGREGVDEVKDLFSPNKLKIVELPSKDPNAMLVGGQVRDFVQAWWGAKSYQPAGVLLVSETWDQLLEYRNTPSIPYPWQGLTDILQGIRTREVVVVAAETGIGKSQTMREIQQGILEHSDSRVGCLMLEESVAKTTLGWMSFAAGRPLHKELNDIPDEELRRYWEQVSVDDRLVLLEHNGWGHDFEILKSRIRYMAKSLDCRYIVLDHLHYALSTVEGASGDWSGIDELVTQIVSLAIECDISIHLVCHTSAPRSLRGSKGIAKLADAVVYLERDSLNADPVMANTTQVIVAKNRWCGDVGTAAYLYYDPNTGRMTETEAPLEVVDEF